MKYPILVSLLFSVIGCSTDDDASGRTGSTSSVDCAGPCERLAASHCANEGSVSECIDECHADLDGLQAECASEVFAYTSCVESKATLGCSPDGTSKIAGCDSEVIQLSQCKACAPSSEDSACDSCIKTSCCQEMSSYVAGPSASAYSACLNACSDDACEAKCDAAHPESAASYHAVFVCSVSACLDVCGA